MHDLKWLREHPDIFDASLKRRGQAPLSGQILALDREHRRLLADVQERETRRNALSKDIGRLRGKGEDAAELIAEVGSLRQEVQAGREAASARAAELGGLLAGVPSVLDEAVPDGVDESENIEIRRVGSPRNFAFEPVEHDQLGARLGMDFERAAKLSGARFCVLRGQLARLERALAQLMLDMQTVEHGYTEVAVPYMVRDDALYGTGQLPKYADDLFRTNTEHWLIPTAEVPLSNLVAGDILDGEKLPLRFTACTPCFRSEAGAAGRDTRGMIRQHQFLKVELVSITRPEQSDDEHERLTECAEAVLKRLELPYRVVTLCSGDTGFQARKTYDLEVWLPGQKTYREISSCSNCGDFQARRMNARFRDKGDRRTTFVHTLNGSGLAVGRTLVAVLENGQEADGSITLPEALRPYMNNIERLTPID